MACTSKEAPTELWWGFTSSDADSPQFLNDTKKCQELLNFVVQQNSDTIEKFPKAAKVQAVIQGLKDQKAKFTFMDIPITKQMLERARDVLNSSSSFQLQALGQSLPNPNGKQGGSGTLKGKQPERHNEVTGRSTSEAEALDDERSDKRTGKVGKPVRVVTNYVHVTQLPQYVYEYNITYGNITSSPTQGSNGTTANSSPARGISQTSQKRLVFEGLSAPGGLLADREDWGTDYSTFWSLTPLDNNDWTTTRIVIGPVSFKKLSGWPSTLSNVSFSFVRRLDFHSGNQLSPAKLLESLDDTGASVRVTAINGLISAVVKKRANVIHAGANRFYSRSDVELRMTAIQAHRGYFTSIRPGTDRILLNIGTMTGTFYKSLKVSEFMDICNERNLPKFRKYGGDCETVRDTLLAGQTVSIDYKRKKHHDHYDPNLDEHRKRVISELGDTPNLQKFKYNGVDMTVSQYFTSILNHPTPSVNYRTVNVGVKRTDNPDTHDKQIYIPAEFVTLLPDQRFARLLSDHHMTELSNFALILPQVTRSNIVTKGFPLLGLSDDRKPFSHLGVQANPNLLSIPARLADPPQIYYRSRPQPYRQQKLMPATVVEASWNLKDVNFITPGTAAPGIHVIDFRLSEGGDEHPLQAARLSAVLKEYGMQVGSSTSSWSLFNQEPSDHSEATLLSKLREHHRTSNFPNLHLVILDVKENETYGRVKRIYDQHIGAHTVCITFAKAEGAKSPLLANLALKYNAKCRGINHQVSESGGLNIFRALKDDTMIVGADVSHAGAKMAHCPSVAAVVASDDETFAHFPGSMRLQASKQEFLDDLVGMMQERLLRYCNAHKGHSLPKRIIFFRDGVGEDMYVQVRENEIPAVKNAFMYIRQNVELLKKNGKLPASFRDHGNDLQLTFIVCGKRHNTRFFPTDSQDKGNVRPGLIVDRVITRPAVDDTMDFFLQSHKALKGTARSAHYVVLEQGAFDIDSIQTYTHALCYNFARATKGVSYAAPAYYADRLADRGTHYLKAYTQGRDKLGPGIEMTDEEKGLPVKAGLRKFERRVAEHIQSSAKYNPNQNVTDSGALDKRINPWHPNLDTVMFWI